MKKLFLAVVLLVCISAASLFAWEPADLMKYPVGQDAGDWILNVGLGFEGVPYFGRGYFWIPPIYASLDRNVPLSDNKLPFFFGGKVGFWGNGYKYQGTHWFYGALSLGFRFGYHFNWDIPNFDTYAVTTAGWGIYMGSKDYWPHKYGYPTIGINLGARYFVTDLFGFWVEVGGGSYFNANIGLSFKF